MFILLFLSAYWFNFARSQSQIIKHIFQSQEHSDTGCIEWHLECRYYELTPLYRVPLEKLIVTQLFRKFRTFHGNRRFITVFTKARHLSLY